MTQERQAAGLDPIEALRFEQRAVKVCRGASSCPGFMREYQLVVQTSAPARNGGASNVTKVTYKRYERGFGG